MITISILNMFSGNIPSHLCKKGCQKLNSAADFFQSAPVSSLSGGLSKESTGLVSVFFKNIINGTKKFYESVTHPKKTQDLSSAEKPSGLNNRQTEIENACGSIGHKFKTKEAVKNYLKSFEELCSKKDIKNFVKLSKNNPEQFNKIADSGFFELSTKGIIDYKKFTVSPYSHPVTHKRAEISAINDFKLSDRTLSEIKKIKEHYNSEIRNVSGNTGKDPIMSVVKLPKDTNPEDIKSEGVFSIEGTLYSYKNGDLKPKQLAKPSLVREIPQNADKTTWISENISLGDVYQNGEELFIKTETGTEKLGLTKEKFDELFPPLSSVFQQGAIGDCWLLSTIDNLFNYPRGKAAIYKMFKQEGQNIKVVFPDKCAITFIKGEVIDAGSRQVDGAKGIQMLEQAFAAKHSPVSITKKNAYDVMPILEYKRQRGIPQKEYGADKALEAITGKGAETIEKEQRYTQDGYKYYVKINRKTPKKYTNEEVKTEIINAANDPNTAANISFSNGSFRYIDQKRLLTGNHAYAIRSYDPKTKMLHLTNPWNDSVETTIPMEEALKYFRGLHKCLL